VRTTETHSVIVQDMDIYPEADAVPPPLTSADLAKSLHLSEERLVSLLSSAEKSYNRFPLKCGRRRPRWIEAPNPFLKHVQRCLLDKILYTVVPHPSAHGFQPGRSIVSNARMHSCREWVLSMDMKDFFPTTDIHMVEKMLQEHFNFTQETIEAILRLTCRRNALPQGAPTSPHLANLVFMEGDRRLTAMAIEHGMTYTRYADDMTFSGDTLPEDIEEQVELIAQEAGYRISRHKTRRMGQHQCQKVTGLVVNEGVRLPRGKRRRLRAILNDVRKNGMDAALARSGFRSADELSGHLALARMVGTVQ